MKRIFQIISVLIAGVLSSVAQPDPAVLAKLQKQYKTVTYDDHGYYVVEKKNARGVADSEGNVIVEPFGNKRYTPTFTFITEADGTKWIKAKDQYCNNAYLNDGRCIASGHDVRYITDCRGVPYFIEDEGTSFRLYSPDGQCKSYIHLSSHNLKFHREVNGFTWLETSDGICVLEDGKYTLLKEYSKDYSNYKPVYSSTDEFEYISLDYKRWQTGKEYNIHVPVVRYQQNTNISPDRKPIRPKDINAAFPITKGTGSLLMASQTGLMIVPESVYVCGVSRIPGSNTGTLRLVFTVKNTTQKIIDNFQFNLSSDPEGVIQLPKGRFIGSIGPGESIEMSLICVFNSSRAEFELMPVVKDDTRAEGVKATLNL